jgi:hypothetical protein
MEGTNGSARRRRSEGGQIGPVDVLEQHHRRLLAGDAFRRVDERAKVSATAR